MRDHLNFTATFVSVPPYGCGKEPLLRSERISSLAKAGASARGLISIYCPGSEIAALAPLTCKETGGKPTAQVRRLFAGEMHRLLTNKGWLLLVCATLFVIRQLKRQRQRHLDLNGLTVYRTR